jgi:hypothetical protein
LPYTEYERPIPRLNEPILTVVSKYGRMATNRIAGERIKTEGIKAFHLLWDSERRLIGLRPAKKDEEYSYPIFFEGSNQTGASWAAKSFLKWIRWGSPDRVRLPIRWNPKDSLFQAQVPHECLKPGEDDSATSIKKSPGFQLFEEKQSRLRKSGVTLLGRTYKIAINADLARILAAEHVDAVVLLWDAESHRMALKPVAKGSKNSFALSIYRHHISGLLTAKSFFEHIGWQSDKPSVKLPATWNKSERIVEVTLPPEYLKGEAHAASPEPRPQRETRGKKAKGD